MTNKDFWLRKALDDYHSVAVNPAHLEPITGSNRETRQFVDELVGDLNHYFAGGFYRVSQRLPIDSPDGMLSEVFYLPAGGEKTENFALEGSHVDGNRYIRHQVAARFVSVGNGQDIALETRHGLINIGNLTTRIYAIPEQIAHAALSERYVAPAHNGSELPIRLQPDSAHKKQDIDSPLIPAYQKT
jgi:hypothetical protein